MLTGQAKTDYQRKYMRLRRLKAKLEGRFVRPSTSKVLDPDTLASLDRAMAETKSVDRGSFAKYVIDADGNPIYED